MQKRYQLLLTGSVVLSIINLAILAFLFLSSRQTSANPIELNATMPPTATAPSVQAEVEALSYRPGAVYTRDLDPTPTLAPTHTPDGWTGPGIGGGAEPSAERPTRKTVKATAAATATPVRVTITRGPLVATSTALPATAAPVTVVPATAPPATAAPTSTPTQLPPTATATATSRPSPTPTPTAGPPFWLFTLNTLREELRMRPVTEDSGWSAESRLHSDYMLRTGAASFAQDPVSPFYTPGGDAAAQSAIVFASPDNGDPQQMAVEYWLSTPFNAVRLLDPRTRTVGFGAAQQDEGDVHVAVTMDIERGRYGHVYQSTYPVLYPAPRTEITILARTQPEYPESLSACPSYELPTGPPIILQLGRGEAEPQVTATSVVELPDGPWLRHCILHENRYYNLNDFDEQLFGQTILARRDAIILVPRHPLEPGKEYRATIEMPDASYSWTFSTAGEADE